MDECPICGASCPVMTPTMKSDTVLHHCVECMVAWKPPRNNHGQRRLFVYPPGAAMSAMSS
jgi:hypothetical protein